MLTRVKAPGNKYTTWGQYRDARI